MARQIRFDLGNFTFFASLARRVHSTSLNYVKKLDLGYGRALEERSPYLHLRDFQFVLTKENAGAVTAFYATFRNIAWILFIALQKLDLLSSRCPGC
jgi:hypothetical protein